MTQIICTLITFAGALALLWINQWFTSKHKQTEILSSKLEDLFAALDSLNSGGYFSVSDEDLSKSIEAVQRKGKESLAYGVKITMLITLYFPDLEGRWNKLRESAEPAYYEMAHFERNSNAFYIFGILEEASTNIRDLQIYISENGAMLTRRVFDRISPIHP